MCMDAAWSQSHAETCPIATFSSDGSRDESIDREETEHSSALYPCLHGNPCGNVLKPIVHEILVHNIFGVAIGWK